MSASLASRNSTNVRYAGRVAWHRLRLALSAAFAPDKAVELAARLFATPPRYQHTAAELEALSMGQRFDVVSGTARIAAWRFGERYRPIALMSHGWGGRGAQLRAFIPALLEAGFQVVLFDHVGHGMSEGRQSSLVHFIQAIDALAAEADRQGERVAAVVGHSLGAAAAGAWLNETRREARVVLLAPPTSLERWSSFFARRLGIAEPVRRAMQERIERALGRRWKEFELPHSVANVHAQALVIHDSGDRDVSPAAGLALARAWPGARLVTTHGLGHRGILRDAGVVRDAVDFLVGRVVFAPPPAANESLAFGAPAPLV